MRKKYWVVATLFLIMILQSVDIHAQNFEKNYSIQWKEPVTQTLSEDRTLEYLSFENCIYLREYPSLPSVYEIVEIPSFFEHYNISVSSVEYEALSARDVALVPDEFHQAQLCVNAYSAFERKKPYLVITFIPIVETSKGHYSRVKSLSLSVQGSQPRTLNSTKDQATRSVLASGQWYRIAVTRSGIFKVTYNDLVAMGMQPPIQSAQLALFGNGGTMLPENNAISRPDDLNELPIRIFDNGDGTIDNGDYFIFYGKSPHSWAYQSSDQTFRHATNIYCDSSYYFITNTAGVGEKKRITAVNNASLQANMTKQDFVFYDFLEEDKYNLGESGREWFGDLFDITTSRNYLFATPIPTGAQGRVSVAVATVSNSPSRMSVSANNVSIGQVPTSSITSSRLAVLNNVDMYYTPSGQTLNVGLVYNKPGTTSLSYLDWIEVEIPCRLTMYTHQFPFCQPSTIGPGNVTEFVIQDANTSISVWDITDPSQTVQYNLQNNTGGASFKVPTDDLRQFIAFDGTAYYEVTPVGRVNNQNLHASSSVDLVIVTHPDFKSQAQRLAKFRQENDGLSVQVVTTQEVYNEFSSGSQDPIAIRDYMRMIYNRTNGEYPKYLLLFGRPCYDFRGRVANTKVYVPNYQYQNQNDYIGELNFYCNDDALGLLDDTEGELMSGLFDLAIGRFPCSTMAQAVTAVDKSILYTTRTNLVEEGSSSISNLADWRNVMAYVADDEEWNDFISNTDSFTQIVKEKNPNINFDKIYLDAYQQVSNAGGQRYPEVNTDINNRMNRGALVMTYVGHSGKDGWAAERILEISDINRWNNYYNMPLMLTLSCTFGYYDRPTPSPADYVFFNNHGGAAALITATREAWSGSNNSYGYSFSRFIFDKEKYGRYPTIGELAIYGKNVYTGSASNLGMFVLYGDPSMPLALPRYKVVTDSINHYAVEDLSDTLSALSKVTISGHIVDDNNILQSQFNGTLFPSVYDKAVNVNTLQNDPNSAPFNFEVQKSILFKGNSSIQNGRFSFSFYIPKDINYEYGNGKISYYARSAQSDAAGAFTDFIIGGTDTTGLDDQKGPEIELYLNDEHFVDGGIVNSTPVLIAKIKDDYGINTTGNGIGHDLTAIIDGSSDSQIILNDYYQTEKDSFNMGTVRYQMNEQGIGKHTLMLRAWDINNNHAEKEITFEVVSDEKLTLSHVLNYPNPFTTHTDFYFEHNRSGGIFDIQVQIYTISGKLLKTIHDTQYLEGNRSNPISWDGLDDFGDKIGKGVYMYRLRVREQGMETAEVIEKLVIL